MPTFQFKNGETVVADSIDEARTKRDPNFGKASSQPESRPAVRPAINPQSMEYLQATGGDIEAAKGLSELNTGAEKTLPAGILTDLGDFDTGIRFMHEMAKLKNTGFSGKPIDTGPVVGLNAKVPFTDTHLRLVPDTLSQKWNEKVEGMSPYDATARARLRQMHLETLNPKRKQITGAAAPESELTKFIMPLLPGDDVDDANFNATLLQAANNSRTQKLENIKKLREGGYSVPENDESEQLINEIIGFMPPEHRPGYKKPGIGPRKRPSVMAPKENKDEGVISLD